MEPFACETLSNDGKILLLCQNYTFTTKTGHFTRNLFWGVELHLILEREN